jgi:hypothetical protein
MHASAWCSRTCVGCSNCCWGVVETPCNKKWHLPSCVGAPWWEVPFSLSLPKFKWLGEEWWNFNGQGREPILNQQIVIEHTIQSHRLWIVFGQNNLTLPHLRAWRRVKSRPNKDYTTSKLQLAKRKSFI